MEFVQFLRANEFGGVLKMLEMILKEEANAAIQWILDIEHGHHSKIIVTLQVYLRPFFCR